MEAPVPKRRIIVAGGGTASPVAGRAGINTSSTNPSTPRSTPNTLKNKSQTRALNSHAGVIGSSGKVKVKVQPTQVLDPHSPENSLSVGSKSRKGSDDGSSAAGGSLVSSRWHRPHSPTGSHVSSNEFSAAAYSPSNNTPQIHRPPSPVESNFSSFSRATTTAAARYNATRPTSPTWDAASAGAAAGGTGAATRRAVVKAKPTVSSPSNNFNTGVHHVVKTRSPRPHVGTSANTTPIVTSITTLAPSPSIGRTYSSPTVGRARPAATDSASATVKPSPQRLPITGRVTPSSKTGSLSSSQPLLVARSQSAGVSSVSRSTNSTPMSRAKTSLSEVFNTPPPSSPPKQPGSHSHSADALLPSLPLSQQPLSSPSHRKTPSVSSLQGVVARPPISSSTLNHSPASFNATPSRSLFSSHLPPEQYLSPSPSHSQFFMNASSSSTGASGSYFPSSPGERSEGFESEGNSTQVLMSPSPIELTTFDEGVSTGSAPVDDRAEDLPEAVSNEIAELKVNRKILDLEISNTSLLAINHALESAKARQNKEIRDLRRKLRTGSVQPFPSRPTPSRKGTSHSILSDGENGDSSDSEPEIDEEDDEQFIRCKSMLEHMLANGREAIQTVYDLKETSSKRVLGLLDLERYHGNENGNLTLSDADGVSGNVTPAFNNDGDGHVGENSAAEQDALAKNLKGILRIGELLQEREDEAAAMEAQNQDVRDAEGNGAMLEDPHVMEEVEEGRIL